MAVFQTMFIQIQLRSFHSTSVNRHILNYLHLISIALFLLSCNRNHLASVKSSSSSLVFNTAYHQFYLVDKGSDNDTGGDFWSKAAEADRLAVNNRLIGVSTASYGRIQANVKVVEKEPIIQDLSKFDHAVEAGITIESGVIEIADCPNAAVIKEIKVSPGNYRFRIYFANLIGVIDDDGADSYVIEVWPSEDSSIKVLKRFCN